MKRALTAAVIGGLMTLFVPHGALAHDADQRGGESAEKTEQSGEPEQQPAPDERRQGDGESHDSDGSFLLF